MIIARRVFDVSKAKAPPLKVIGWYLRVIICFTRILCNCRITSLYNKRRVTRYQTKCTQHILSNFSLESRHIGTQTVCKIACKFLPANKERREKISRLVEFSKVIDCCSTSVELSFQIRKHRVERLKSCDRWLYRIFSDDSYRVSFLGAGWWCSAFSILARWTWKRNFRVREFQLRRVRSVT